MATAAMPPSTMPQRRNGASSVRRAAFVNAHASSACSTRRRTSAADADVVPCRLASTALTNFA